MNKWINHFGFRFWGEKKNIQKNARIGHRHELMRLLSVAPTNECEWNMLATEVPPKVSMVLFPIQDIPHTDTYTNALTQMHAYDCTVYMHARSSYYSFGQIYTEQTFTRHDTKTNKTKIILDRSQNHFSFVCLLCVWVKEGLKQKKGRRSREPNRDAENRKKKTTDWEDLFCYCIIRGRMLPTNF